MSSAEHARFGRLARVVLGAMIAVLALAVACGGSGGGDDGTPGASSSAVSEADREVQAVFRQFVDAWNAKDADTALALWTDAGLTASFGEGEATRAEIEEQIQPIIGAPELGGVAFLETSVDGDTATLDTQFTVGVAYARSIFTLVRRNDAWLIDNEESNLDIRVPAGAARLDVVLDEFSFEFDVDALTGASGVVAITARNIGSQDHEMGVLRVDDGIDLLAALGAEPVEGADPEGLEFVGGGFVASLDVIVFGFSQFVPGRYAFVCMLPDTSEGPEGAPHALKGMLAEFTIEPR